MAPTPGPDDTQEVLPLDEAFVPPAGGGADVVRLELRVEELERRLKARTLELETELRGKERLRSRIEELSRRIAELEETAACLHREAVSATALSQELDETLRVASEAQRHLDSALQAERERRETAEQSAHAGLSELKRRDSELKEARRQIQISRQKVDGHEAHIESLRSEVQEERQRRLEGEKGLAALEARALAAEKDARAAMENAETIRREGVESFEKAREAALGLQLQEDALRRERAGLESLKAEVRARAEREMTDLRAALDAERDRMHLDLEAENRGARALGPAGEAVSERFERLRAQSQESRLEIARQARGAEAPAPTEPSQVRDELRLAFRAALAAILIAAAAASVLFFQR